MQVTLTGCYGSCAYWSKCTHVGWTLGESQYLLHRERIKHIWLAGGKLDCVALVRTTLVANNSPLKPPYKKGVDYRNARVFCSIWRYRCSWPLEQLGSRCGHLCSHSPSTSLCTSVHFFSFRKLFCVFWGFFWYLLHKWSSTSRLASSSIYLSLAHSPN